MKKIKIASILLLGILSILISAQTIKSSADTKVNEKNLIAELKDKEISLYYDQKTDSAMLKGFYLKMGDTIKYFDWESIDKPGFYPTLSLIQDKYIAIICTLGEGSGFNEQQLHLINKDSLEEIKYQNPLEVMNKQVKTTVKAPSVHVRIGNNIWKSSYPNVKNFSNFFKTVSYENMITYDVTDNSFKVILKAQVSPSLFIGEFEINYIMGDKKDGFIPDTINFNFEDIEIS
jgi:hypothetical protein